MGNLFPLREKSIMGSLFLASKKEENDEWGGLLPAQRSQDITGENQHLRISSQIGSWANTEQPLFSSPFSASPGLATWLLSQLLSVPFLISLGRVSWTPWF